MTHSSPTDATGDPLLRVVGASKHFADPALFGRKSKVRAVDGVSLEIRRGETYGIVGESGCGKSTLARLITRLIPLTEGHLILNGQDYSTLRGGELRRFRRHMQMVFQDPSSSFDPTRPLLRTVTEPIEAGTRLSSLERKKRAEELFDLVGLRPALLDRRPAELSGGQLQRAAIARALGSNPQLIVLDEAVSALDASNQAQIINLLANLQRDHGISFLFVSHNLAVVRHSCSRVGVMHLGKIVEEGPIESLFAAPAHPYTAALLAAVPRIEPNSARPRLRLDGEPPSPMAPPSGCRFRTRCPWAMSVCSIEDPPAFVTSEGATAYCHLHRHGPVLDGRSVNTLLNSNSAAGGTQTWRRSGDAINLTGEA
jgi:oligopeptide/dipeptide ABC transporter ATP-binding protein